MLNSYLIIIEGFLQLGLDRTISERIIMIDEKISSSLKKLRDQNVHNNVRFCTLLQRFFKKNSSELKLDPIRSIWCN